jgi:hypothetical protein
VRLWAIGWNRRVIAHATLIRVDRTGGGTMMALSRGRRGMAGFGLGLGLGAVVALVVAAAGPAAARADTLPALSVDFPSVTVAPDSAGQARYVVVRQDSGRDVDYRDVTIVIDASGAAGVVTPGVSVGSSDCAAAGQVITCRYEVLSVPRYGTGQVQVTLKAADGAGLGATGAVRVTVSAGGGAPAGHTATVTIGEGVDLSNATGDLSLTAAPGGTVAAPLSVRNSGTAAVRGVVLQVFNDYALTYAKRYSNCEYGPDSDGAVCTFDAEIPPGSEYRLSDPVSFKLRPDTEAPGVEAADYLWETPADADEWFADWRAREPVRGTEGTLRLVPVAQAAGQTDVNHDDNFGVLDVEVTGSNGIDFAAVGATVRGDAGATVEATVGVANRGPATRDASRIGDPANHARVVVPAGTTVVSAPYSCHRTDTPGGETPVPGQPGGREYLCGTDAVLVAGDTYTWRFGLRIDRRDAGAGTVAVNVNTAAPEPIVDVDPADDVARILVNPPGGTGGGDGLPITGTNVAVLVGAGLVLVGLGGTAVRLARRRTRFQA